MIDLTKPESLPQSLYWTTDYLSPERFSSIGYQWKLAVESGSNSFLEIGPGGGLLTILLRAKGLDVITSDINKSLKPSVAIGLPLLPFRDKAVEVVLCFEVLEHIQWEFFLPSLREIKRVASNKVIISLPNCKPSVVKPQKYSVFGAVYWGKKVLRSILDWAQPTEVDYQIPLEHRWEIGVLNISADIIIEHAKQIGLSHKEDFRNPHSPYHHFFVFEVV